MYITVDEALMLPCLASAVLVAGKKGVSRRITTVNIMEVPEITRYVKADELIITTMYPIRDNEQLQKTLIPDLAQKGVSALLVVPIFMENDIPQYMIEQADFYDFPLVKLPFDTSFNEILNPILEQILDRQTAQLKKNAQINKKFMDILLNGGSLSEIAKVIHSENGLPVALYSPYALPMTCFGTYEWQLLETYIENADVGVSQHMLENEEYGKSMVWMYTVMYGGERYATIILCIPQPQLNAHPIDFSIEKQMIEQASAVVALEITRLRKQMETEYSYRSRIIDDLLHDKVTSRSQIISIGKSYGWDLSGSFIPVVIEIHNSKENYDKSLIFPIQNVVQDCIKIGISSVIPIELNNCLLLLFQQTKQQEKMIKLILHMCQSFIRQFDDSWIGIGRSIGDIMRLSQSFDQAITAINLARKMPKLGKVVHFDDLGVYRVLLDMPDLKQNIINKSLFIDEKIGKLIHQDQSNNTDYILTLETFFEQNCNMRQSAKKLFIHHNTMRYRLDQIESLLGVSLKDSNICLEIQIALKLRTITVT